MREAREKQGYLHHITNRRVSSPMEGRAGLSLLDPGHPPGSAGEGAPGQARYQPAMHSSRQLDATKKQVTYMTRASITKCSTTRAAGRAAAAAARCRCRRGRTPARKLAVVGTAVADHLKVLPQPALAHHGCRVATCFVPLASLEGVVVIQCVGMPAAWDRALHSSRVPPGPQRSTRAHAHDQGTAGKQTIRMASDLVLQRLPIVLTQRLQDGPRQLEETEGDGVEGGTAQQGPQILIGNLRLWRGMSVGGGAQRGRRQQTPTAPVDHHVGGVGRRELDRPLRLRASLHGVPAPPLKTLPSHRHCCSDSRGTPGTTHCCHPLLTACGERRFMNPPE